MDRTARHDYIVPMTSTDETSNTADTDAKPPAEAASETPRRAGTDVIQHYLKLLPTSPGVYRMIGAAGEVLYVGKAKSLKKRVLAYARPYWNQIIGMLVTILLSTGISPVSYTHLTLPTNREV